MVGKRAPGKTNILYSVLPDFRRRTFGRVLENAAEVAWPGCQVLGRNHDVPGLPPFTERPRYRYEPKLGGPPLDFNYNGSYWLVSSRMKAIIAHFAPDDVEFRECDVISANKDHDKTLWLCAVLLTLHAVDEVASNVKLIPRMGKKAYIPSLRPWLYFNWDIVNGKALFDVEFAGVTACNEEFRLACKSEKMTGISFDRLSL